MIPETASLWRDAYEAQKAVADLLKQENQRLHAELAARPASAGTTGTLDPDVEEAIITYSFGDEQLAAKTRTLAIKMLAAKVAPSEVVKRLEAGGSIP